ncbi:O-antigen ligase [uncultured Cellulomonas sp.]|uniref:O-antigen ligase family protein n=1 Tax=uncultured Cellulomonas sp. TaxID=189682 RepID=UPI0026023CDD|nr:O-antigen ligase family protein [uncultured Cellulomonas sp.]
MRIALAVLCAVTLVSYALAQVRGLPADEASPADTGLLRLMSLAGVLLVANDGVDTRERLAALMHRVALAGGLMAALGIAQFFTGQSWIASIELPGFSSDVDLASLQSRSGFIRPSGTATHPLEYAAVLAAAFPIAVTAAIHGTVRGRVRRWLPVVAIATATVLSVSRSAPLGVAVGALVLLPTWSRRVRRRAAVSAALLLGVVYVTVPGMIGTLRNLFVGARSDPSTISRTSSYDLAVEIAGRHVWFGRGFGTFLPAYRILDNQYLQTLIEIGLIGLAALLALIATATACAVRARRFAALPHDREVAVALVASTTSVAALFAFFDAFMFPMAVGILFLLIGMCGAARNVLGEDESPAGDSPARTLGRSAGSVSPGHRSGP